MTVLAGVPSSADANAELLALSAELSGDPYRWVMWAFPWGEPNTELAEASGPEDWQKSLLLAVRDGLLTLDQALRLAVASGHGVGKSALVSWLILWSLTTFEDTRGVVTANTETQLRTKTWAELAKWYRLCLTRDFFKMTATAIYSVDPEHERTWRIDMVPWSEHNPEAFAGLHNKNKRILLVFDEASAIADIIWETAAGALTDLNTQIIWLVCGNPTKSTGMFRECFETQAHRWKTFRVDARTVSITNKAQHQEWIEDFGLDSDWVRVRVLGQFPKVGTSEFISRDLALSASTRTCEESPYAPLVLGVDVARFGDDASVICFRRGRDARSIREVILRGASTMDVAGRVAALAEEHSPDAIFVDGTGVGGGVVDRLRQLRVDCFDINFGSRPDRATFGDANKYANKRAEMWGNLREWLATGCIPADDDLIRELCSPEYAFNQNMAIQLEKKESMKKRGAASPDRADALALTFAYPVLPRQFAHSSPSAGVTHEYDPLSAMESR